MTRRTSVTLAPREGEPCRKTRITSGIQVDVQVTYKSVSPGRRDRAWGEGLYNGQWPPRTMGAWARMGDSHNRQWLPGTMEL